MFQKKIKQSELNKKYAECLAAEKRANEAFEAAQKVIAECVQVQREQKLIVESVLKMLVNHGAIIQRSEDVLEKLAGWNVGRMPEVVQ